MVPTKTPIKGSLSSIGFKLLSGQGFNVQGHHDLDFLIPKQIGIIYKPWSSKTPIMVFLSSIGFY